MVEVVLALLMGPVVFWCIVLVGLIILIGTTEPLNSDQHVVPGLIFGFLGYLAIERFGNPFSAQVWAAVAVGYFVIGAIWSMVKWYFLNRDIRDIYVETRDQFIAKNSITVPFPYSKLDIENSTEPEAFEKQNRDFRDSVYGAMPHRGYASAPVMTREEIVNAMMPKAERMKSRIIRWILFWPTSVVWALINNPVYHIGQWIYKSVRGQMGKITAAMFSDLK